jgi:hypothetical protein
MEKHYLSQSPLLGETPEIVVKPKVEDAVASSDDSSDFSI